MPAGIRSGFAIIVVVALMHVAMTTRAAADDLLVFAAASLTHALNRIGDSWTTETGHQAVMSFAGSSALARQIQRGAPADIFISASVDWMDAIEASGDLRKGTRRDLLGNTLVLIAHGRSATPVTIDRNLDLVGMLGRGRLSMAMVDAVPAGIYGKEALVSMGLWERVAPLVVQSYNVRSALAFVARGEAPFGIVYATDAVIEDNVSILGVFPEGSHPPIIYPVAITRQGNNPRAPAFLAYLFSERAAEIWRSFGFAVAE